MIMFHAAPVLSLAIILALSGPTQAQDDAQRRAIATVTATCEMLFDDEAGTRQLCAQATRQLVERFGPGLATELATTERGTMFLAVMALAIQTMGDQRGARVQD